MFSNSVITFICMIYVMLYIVEGTRKCHEEDKYCFRVPKHFWKHCKKKISIDDKNTACPDLNNVTHVFVEQLLNNMRPVTVNLGDVNNTFLRALNADSNFLPMVISDLDSIEDSGIAKHIRKSNKPEEIIHKIYARVALLYGYLELVQFMLENLTLVPVETSRDINSIVKSLDTKIIPISCQPYEFTEKLGISKIKKKIFRYEQRIKNVESERNKIDFIITVLMEGEKYAKESEADLKPLLTAVKTCKYKNCLGKRKMKLTCEGEDESDGKLKSGQKRKDRKLKRNKKKIKGRKHRKNKDKKRGKTDISSKGNSTLSKGMKHRRHRKKSRKVD